MPTAITLDTLEVKATGNVSDAIRKIDELQAKLNGLRGSAVKASEGTKATESGIKKMGDSATKTTGKLGSLLSSVKRIAMYRLIRSAIKAVTTGFSDGVKNAYAWAEANNHAFKSVMDTYATKATYIKNSLGALAANALTAFLPAFEALANGIVKVVNGVSEFVAAIKGALTGDYSYIRAKEVAVEFGDATNDAASAQKRLNQQLMKFDELNVITTKQAAGKDALSNVNDMFEEATASDWMRKNWGLIAGGTALTLVLTNWLGGALKTAVSNAILGGGGQAGVSSLIGGAAASLGAVGIALAVVFTISEYLISGLPSEADIEAEISGAYSSAKTKANETGTAQTVPYAKVKSDNGVLSNITNFLATGKLEYPSDTRYTNNGYTIVYPDTGAPHPEIEEKAAELSKIKTTISNGPSDLKPSKGPILDSLYNSVEKLKKATGYASGGFPDMGSVFIAGEVPGQTEMVGTINGRTGVASGDEITGISEAVYSTGNETAGLLRELISVVRSGGSARPSAAFGKFVNESMRLYKGVTG